MTGEPYNPLDKRNLGRSVAEALLLQPVKPLAAPSGLAGAGVYALYYTGGFPPYEPVSVKNRDGSFAQPIYVGKAVPEGARKGGMTFDSSRGRALQTRLKEHAKSISEVHNLDILDFHFRSLVVDDIWIPLGENMMIEEFQPIWNRVIDGFGNKIPGKNRPQQKSLWDVMHPGRKSMRNLLDGGTTLGDVEERLKRYFEGRIVPLIPNDEAADEGVVRDDGE